MGWLMPLIIALFIIGNWFHAGNTERAIKNTDEQQRQQQAYEILRLTNAIIPVISVKERCLRLTKPDSLRYTEQNILFQGKELLSGFLFSQG